MQITGAAISNVNNIGGFLDKLFNKTAKVNIALMGDGNCVRQQTSNHGWDAGIVDGLLNLNLKRHGTGIIGCGTRTGYEPGHGHFAGLISSNDVPLGTTANNGFTAYMPSEWHPYLTNWGTGVTSEGAINDNQITSLGLLSPFAITSDKSVTITTVAYTLHGNGDWINQSRAFEGITSALDMQLWYLKTDAALTGGSARTIDASKATDAARRQLFRIDNINSTAAAAAGATFSITVGLTTTPGITFPSDYNFTTLQTRIAAAINSAFPTWNPSVAGSNSGLRDGDMIFSLATGGAFPDNTIVVNYGGLTHRYYDATYAPSLTTVTAVAAAGSAFSPTYFSGVNLTAGSSVLNTTGPAHLARRDFAISASGSRDSGIRLRWGNSLSGPWCSMFVATSISGTTNGFSTSTIMDLDKRSARAQLVALRNQSSQYLGSVFQALAEHAGYTSPAQAPLLIRVVGGAFDVADTAGSTGPSGGLTSNTRDGLRDNWQGIVNRVHDVYSSNGWTASNLYWLFVSSQPTVANDSNLNFARLAAVDMSTNNARAAAVNLFTINGGITNDITALSSISLAQQPDASYSTYTGYRTYSQVEWSSIQQAYGASPPPSNVAPTASFTWPSPIVDSNDDGEEYVLVNASSSTDSDGTIASYNWTYTDPNSNIQSTSGVTASLLLPVGNNLVQLQVTDDDGATGTTSGTIVVSPYSAPPSPGNPTATITAVPGFIVTDTDDNGSETILFSGAGSTSPNGAITNYAWSKNGVSTGASGVTTSMLFTVTGTNQTVGLMVTDISGNTASSLQYITVNPKPTGPGAVSNSTTIWFGGKVLSTEQYVKILEAFYPNLLR